MRQCRAGSVGPQIPRVLRIRPAPLTGLRRVLPRARSCLTPPCPHRSIPVLAALCAQIVPHVVWHQIRAPLPETHAAAALSAPPRAERVHTQAHTHSLTCMPLVAPLPPMRDRPAWLTVHLGPSLCSPAESAPRHRPAVGRLLTVLVVWLSKVFQPVADVLDQRLSSTPAHCQI